MKKAMNSIIKKRGDDGKQNRLLSYLQKKLPIKIEKLIKIRHHVYEVHTDETKFILKGFPSHHLLQIQENFTCSLKKEGFHKTYKFYSSSSAEILLFDAKYYGCLEFIEPGKKPFFYDSIQQCTDALDLLQHFHEITAGLVDNYQPFLREFSLKEKWLARFLEFQKNSQVLSFFLRQDILHELHSWAKWSINGLIEEWESFTKYNNVILHGDTAYHNFLRTSKNELYLIDFDLISIGPAVNDYLQFANRILPVFNWEIETLLNYKQFRAYLDKRFFLFALAFPTDLFREWNRLVRERKYHDPHHVRPLMEFTMEQMERRRDFIHQLNRWLNKDGVN